MDFIANREKQIEEMLAFLGKESFIKESFVVEAGTDDGLSEYEGLKLLEGIGAKNRYLEYESYLGAGAYEHHVPAIVQAICSKSEFLTSYTQYQAEISQGMLLALFEFQSTVAALTGLDVSNASLYEASSAVAEAVLMAMRITKEHTVWLSSGLHPRYRAVVYQYLKAHEVKFVENREEALACVVEQVPNFYGEMIQDPFRGVRGTIKVLVSNPLSFGLFPSAKELGADIVVGDLQPFGMPLQYGGPYVGYIASKREFLRELPGRIVGKSQDQQGREAYVLTLQAREQHIRRSKATSNICSNQALMALASLVTMLWYGPEGIKKLALTNYQRARYLRESLKKTAKVSQEECFNEFWVCFRSPAKRVMDHFMKHKIIPGHLLEDGRFLVAVTETKSQEQLKRYCDVANSL